MSKLSKRAISTLVIAIFILSMITVIPAYAGGTGTCTVLPTTVLASSTGNTLTFTFTAAEPMDGGEISIVMPAGWSAPQGTSGTAGYTTATTSGDIGTLTFSSQEVIVPITTLLATGTITVVYGDGGGASGATAQPTAGTATFTTGSSSSGVDTLAPIVTSPTVDVQLATGTLSITTTPVNGELTVTGPTPFSATAPHSQSVDVGTYTVTFGEVEGFITPDSQSPVVTADTTTDVVGIYVLISPSGFTIDSVTPSGPVVYDLILTVFGSGVTGGSEVIVYWDFATGTYVHPLNSTEGNRDGSFDLEVTVPSDVLGEHYLWVKDVATGATVKSNVINMVPKITLSPSSGLKGDEVTIKGYGFSEDADVPITFPDDPPLSTEPGTAETDEMGYFEYKFKVAPDVTDTTYDVDAKDPFFAIVSAEFKVGAAITLDKTVGPAGTVVKVDGRGFTLAPDTKITSITLGVGGPDVATKDLEFITVSDGKFSAYIIIPSASEGTYDVIFKDGIKEASAKFEVDGETSITVTPDYGTPGTLLTVKGYNFTRISGTDVTLKLGDRIAEATTDSSGSFIGTIVIPPSDLGVDYPVIATDVRFCTAEDEVLVTIIFLQLSDLSAPVGSDVILMGSGFTAGLEGKWNATFGDLDLIKTTPITTSGQTYFSETFYVPSLPSGTYPIGVHDVTREITVFIDFTITEQAALSVSRAAIPNGYNLTIKGVNFAEKAGLPTQWWIFNSTDAWDLNLETNVTYGGDFVPKISSEKDEEGTFTGYYKIPEFLELGTYTINCTTVSNAPTGEDWEIIQTAEVDIEIVPEELVIHIGSPSYARGQTITFVIKTTLKKEPFHLGIKDPEGSEFFNSTWNDDGDDDSWKILGSWFYIPSNLQVDKNTQWLYTLPTDATPGTWTYSFWDEVKEYANGTFQVTHLTELEQLREDIGGLSEDIEGIGTSVTDLATTVAGVSGASAEAVAAAAAAAAAAAEAQAAAEAGIAAIDDMSEISQDALDAANNAMSAADAAKDAADAGLEAANAAQATSQAAVDAADKAADAAEANREQTSGLTGLVYGAIGASLIAALAAIVSLMQISRRIAG